MSCLIYFKSLPKGPSLKALIQFFMRYSDSLLTCPRLWCEQDTFTILLPGPVLLMTGSSSQVSRKWEMKLTPSWYSNPSPVVQCGVSCNTVITVSISHDIILCPATLTPAQLTRMSTLLSVSSILAANCFTEERLARSQCSTWNSP